MSSPAPSGEPVVYVIRHGQTEWSMNGRHTGTTDIALTPTGEDQARAAGATVAGIEFAAVWTSPLSRARRTCELAGLAGSAEVLEDLREWDYGDYEGVTTATIRETVPGWTIWSGPWPGGETPEAVAARADRVIARALESPGPVALFAHGHILRVLTARWCELDAREGRRFLLDPATVSILGWEHSMRAVARWNAR